MCGFFLDNLYEIAVRKEFKSIAENINYEVIADELKQKGLLCTKEEDDCVCKSPSKCFWANNLVKLMITKNCCKEFVEIISKMSCHQHVLKIIEGARQKAREPEPEHQNTNGKVVK